MVGHQRQEYLWKIAILAMFSLRVAWVIWDDNRKRALEKPIQTPSQLFRMALPFDRPAVPCALFCLADFSMAGKGSFRQFLSGLEITQIMCQQRQSGLLILNTVFHNKIQRLQHLNVLFEKTNNL
jgi:hypothetical protein